MKRLILGAILASAISFSASAVLIPVNVTPGGADVSKGSVGTSKAEMFAWLSGLGLTPAPVNQNVTSYTSLSSGPLLNISGPSYVVLHYGKGLGGVGDGGGILALFLDGTGLYQVPNTGSGPNGLGGISTVRVFPAAPVPGTPGGSVPDSGSTLALLGLGLVGLIGANRCQRGLSRS